MSHHHLLSCTTDCVVCRRICGRGSPLVPHTATRPWQRLAGSLTGSCGECWLVQEQHWAHVCMGETSIVPLHAAPALCAPSSQSRYRSAFLSGRLLQRGFCARCAATAPCAPGSSLCNKCTSRHERWSNCMARSQRTLPATAWLLTQAHVW